MKRLSITGIIALTLILAACSKVNEGNGDCKYLFGYTDGVSRSTSKTLKGHILFSWTDQSHIRNYAIVPNLNVSAAHENVGKNNSFSGEECLKKNLGFLAEGEEVFWFGNMTIVTTEGDEVSLSYPPDEIMEEIQEYCQSIGIDLMVEK